MSGTMEISQETLETIGSYVKGNLAGWIKEVVPPTVAQLTPDTEARLIRMEESIHGQQELRTDFGARFDDIHRLIDRNTKVFGVVLTVLLVFVGYGTFLG